VEGNCLRWAGSTGRCQLEPWLLNNLIAFISKKTCGPILGEHFSCRQTITDGLCLPSTWHFPGPFSHVTSSPCVKQCPVWLWSQDKSLRKKINGFSLLLAFWVQNCAIKANKGRKTFKSNRLSSLFDLSVNLCHPCMYLKAPPIVTEHVLNSKICFWCAFDPWMKYPRTCHTMQI